MHRFTGGSGSNLFIMVQKLNRALVELMNRKVSPGHYNQCKQVHRRDAQTGESLYKGQYVLTEPLIHGLKERVPTVT